MGYWKSSGYLLRRCKIILHHKKACCEVVVGNSARYWIGLPIVETPSPTDRGKRVYHDSLKVSCLRRGYCIQIALGPDEGDHRMDLHKYSVGRCIPYLLRWRDYRAVVDLVAGRWVRYLYRGTAKMQVDARHIVGHGCMRIDSLWNLRRRIGVEVGEWGSSSRVEFSSAFPGNYIGIRDIVTQVQKEMTVQDIHEKGGSVCRLRCTAGQILAVFLGSCRLAALPARYQYPMPSLIEYMHILSR